MKECSSPSADIFFTPSHSKAVVAIESGAQRLRWTGRDPVSYLHHLSVKHKVGWDWLLQDIRAKLRHVHVYVWYDMSFEGDRWDPLTYTHAHASLCLISPSAPRDAGKVVTSLTLDFNSLDKHMERIRGEPTLPSPVRINIRMPPALMSAFIKTRALTAAMCAGYKNSNLSYRVISVATLDEHAHAQIPDTRVPWPKASPAVSNDRHSVISLGSTLLSIIPPSSSVSAQFIIPVPTRTKILLERVRPTVMLLNESELLDMTEKEERALAHCSGRVSCDWHTGVICTVSNVV
ncbi:unnamed protein product [Leuciscus chuanchicus]